MSSDRSAETAAPHASAGSPTSEPRPDGEDTGNNGQAGENTRREATVLVRGETLPAQDAKSAANPPREQKAKPPARKVSEAKIAMMRRLPALDDDADVRVEKAQLVTRDGKADLAFIGTLLASAALLPASEDQWQEYRIYQTDAGKHVFSKVHRTVFADQQDTHEADIFDPAPASVPSKLLRSARDLAHSRPMTWEDAAVAFFGYDPLAKILYRKLEGQFEEHIS